MEKDPQVPMHLPPSASVGLLGFEASDQDLLNSILDCAESPAAPERKWKIHSQPNVESTLEDLRLNPIPIVLCDRDRTAGAWKDLLLRFVALPDPPLLIVASRMADEHLWAEALNLGAWDVLAKPFDAAEVVRITGLACLRWHQRHTDSSAVMRAVA
jgi:DNA-binding response OmpR family regulator